MVNSPSMLAALDVNYDEATLVGTGAAVVFENWEDDVPTAEYVAKCSDIQPYVPGQFFKRELPCLLAVLRELRRLPNVIILDGYVTLGSKPGLGMYLRDALDKKVPIVGVAKSRFRSADAAEITRGRSKAPLFITSAGIDLSMAADAIRRMHGPYRIPTLLKRVDQLARTGIA